MFLGIRDITHAWGRFTLIGSVVGLITLLLVMLTGLTGGLGAQNTSALSALDPDRYVFSPTVSFTESSVTGADVDAWNGIDGVTATPVGVGMTRLETADGVESVAVIGVPGGRAVASASLLDAPATVTLGGATVDITDTAPDEYYSHAPVVWVDTATWQQVTHSPDDVVGTVLAADGELSAQEWEAASTRTGTTAVTVGDSFAGLPAYRSEQGSLLTMQGFLYAISALVTVSFLTVWTIQRTRDLSILRALGATTRYLVTDALGQAALILGIGVTAGALTGWALGSLAGRVLPFLLTPTTVLAPALGIWLLGILGALVTTRRVAAADPLDALGGNA